MNTEYRVEFENDTDALVSIDYGQNLAAASSRARRASEKYRVAYVVAVDPSSGEATGHKSYGNGCVMETDGSGF